jgi:hypothetical protein
MQRTIFKDYNGVGEDVVLTILSGDLLGLDCDVDVTTGED